MLTLHWTKPLKEEIVWAIGTHGFIVPRSIIYIFIMFLQRGSGPSYYFGKIIGIWNHDMVLASGSVVQRTQIISYYAVTHQNYLCKKCYHKQQYFVLVESVWLGQSKLFIVQCHTIRLETKQMHDLQDVYIWSLIKGQSMHGHKKSSKDVYVIHCVVWIVLALQLICWSLEYIIFFFN